MICSCAGNYMIQYLEHILTEIPPNTFMIGLLGNLHRSEEIL